MKRSLFVSCIAAATALACFDLSTGPGTQLLVVAPVLDSVFVGDTVPARSVFLLDANGNRSNAGPVTWSISPDSIATINAVTGKIVGVSKGTALVLATVSGATSFALVGVSRPLEMTLLMDTIFVMPGDTITVPLAIKQKTPGAYTLRFDQSADTTVYVVDDTTTGRVRVKKNGALRYVVRLADATHNVADTGAVVGMSLADTTGAGRFFMSALGTATRHQGGGALALNYARRQGKLGFQLGDALTSSTADESVLITLRDSVLGAGPFEIDSISPPEAETDQLSATCNPPRPWASWTSVPLSAAQEIIAYSHGAGADSVAGQLIITQYLPVVSGGAIISGRYLFTARRRDLYNDPLGSETIRGTFVAPLRERHHICPA